MQDIEPKKKIKIFTREFMAKYSYVFILALILIIGTSYGLTFFTQNMKITTGSLTTAPLNITITDSSINATNITVPATDKVGLSKIVKTLTITNNGTTDGKVKLTLSRTSGFNLSDLRYAIVVNGAIQEIDDVPGSGVVLDTAIMSSEVINVELRIWPKTTYAGNETTFVGEITPEVTYLGLTAASLSSPAGKYVNFNCDANTCEVWQIVKIENGRLVLTRQEDYSGATERTDSGKYNSSLVFNDNSIITSVSTDNKNVYLAKTVKITNGSGTLDDPYTIINTVWHESDKKIIATITYKNENTTVGTQNIYYNETNYISNILNDITFTGWSDGTNNYKFGDTVNFTVDTILTANKEVNAVNVSYDNTVSNFNCSDFQCAIEALNDYVG